MADVLERTPAAATRAPGDSGTTGPAGAPGGDGGPAAVPAERFRDLASVHGVDVVAVVGSLVASYCLVWLAFTKLLPLDGKVGFALCWFAVFLVVYGVLVWQRETGLDANDKLMAAVWSSAGLLTFTALASVIVFVAVRGPRAIRHLNFFTEDLERAGPLDPLTTGGVLHAVVGTLIMIGIGVVITVPLGIAAAVYLVEVGGPLARVVGTIVDAMTALPSIVAGLFVYAVWIIALNQPQSGLAASLALSIMMLPIIIRTSAVVLRLVPGGLREASFALGASQARTVWSVVLPTARPGLATAVILGMARGIGETSPVLLTAGYATAMNRNPTEGPMTSLPLLVYRLVSSGQPAYIDRAYGAALTLLAIVITLFVLARIIGNRGRTAS